MNLPDLKEARKRTRNNTKVNDNAYYISDKMKNIGKGKTYHIITYGCQMNVHDSENIKAIMEQMSYKENEDMLTSDVIIINTCAVRENAHNKVMGMLGRIKHLKEERKDIITVLCGCMAQEESIVDELKEKYKWVNIVFGTHNIHMLPTYMENAIKSNNQNIEVFSCEGEIIENVPVKRDSKYTAWVNIMYGCDKFCTYCIVPYTRGKQRSRRHEDIINEVNNLVKDGYKEVTLLGQNVNAYGKELTDELSFAELLLKVSDTGIPRLRFVTSHPWDFTDEMIDAIASRDNIMPYIHLPLQSGSSRILKLMGRRYTKEEYLELFKKIRNKVKGCSITTDIIVGFPNETEEDFNETLSVVKECEFDSAFTFIYSPREGTPASKMEDKVTLEEKEQRLYKLNELVNDFSLKANKKYLGKIVPVLIEGINEKDDSKVFGYTDTMKLVNVEGCLDKIGKIINVEITDAKSFSLDGKEATN